MGTKSRGRGAAATFGLLVLLAGIAGGVVLWMMAEQRPDRAVEAFARGPVGCTTTLEFGDTGTFYVYEEVVADDSDAFGECEPVATPDAEFTVELLLDGDPVAVRDDSSISYDTAAAIGTSIARVEIDDVGRYDLVVTGSDPTVVAAIGRDPDEGVDELRRGAIAVAVVGIVLGALLLMLAGRRSKRAATVTTPTGPGWGPSPPIGDAPAWPPVPPRVPQMPVNPMLPPEPAEPDASSEPAGPQTSDPWAPPRASERRDPPSV